MDKFKEIVIEFLKKHTKIDDINLETPPDPKLGDYAFPCFPLAKTLQKSPADIAKYLAKKKISSDLISEIKAVGPYVNFFTNKSKLAENTINNILKQKENYGSSNIGKNKKIIVEHTSINPNASPHVGRARNALIGDSIVRILKFQGYNVETHFYVNDIGKQIALLVIGATSKKNITFDNLLKIYIDINKKLEKNPEIEKDVFELLNKLESGDEKTKKSFKKIVDICIKGQKKIFEELDIKYDYFDYESKYLWDKKTDQVLKELEKTGKLFIDKDDRWVLDLQGFELGMKVPVVVLTRNDKTSLYPLRDIAYTIEKVEKGHNYIVLGEDQKLYFGQIESALKLMGYPTPEVIHYSFVLLKEGKMSTRKGNLVLLEDFMKEAVRKAETEIKKRHSKVNKKTAKSIGYGAIKYAILRVSPEKNVIFNWDQALNFEGETAAYIQYAHARICSILRKSKENPKKPDLNLLTHENEKNIISKLSDFPKIIEKTTDNLKPHLLANYLYELASSFNEFYHSCQILKEEKKLRQSRLILIIAIKQVLSNGLKILGIEPIEKM